MSLDTYANLLLEIAAFSARADTSTSVGGADTFIDMTEAWFNRNLRVRQMTVTNPALQVDANGLLTHPADWAAWKQVAIMAQPMKRLRIYEDPAAVELDHTNASGVPAAVIVRGSYSYVWPVPDSTYTYRGIYWQKVPALSSSQTTNWLLTAYPEAYLYGALFNQAVALRDVEGASAYKGQFDSVVAEINLASNKDTYGGEIGAPVVHGAV